VVGAGNAALARRGFRQGERRRAPSVVIEEGAARVARRNTHGARVLRLPSTDPRRSASCCLTSRKSRRDSTHGISPYPKEDFHGDLMRVTSDAPDPVLSKVAGAQFVRYR